MRRTLLVVVLSIPAVAMAFTAASAIPLQSVYDGAGPGEGYDKLLVLDPGETYTGGMFVEEAVRCCVHGNGALIRLEGASIEAAWYETEIDIDHCVITEGLAGVRISDFATGVIRNNTLYGNTYGIQSFFGETSILIENNVIVENSLYGIYARENLEPIVQYNTVWGNPGGDYMLNCG